MLSDKQIAEAKEQVEYTLPEGGHHEHNDCIRIAYEWLDAQKKLAKPNKRRSWAMKHIIENWAGRYVSQSDVDVAAFLHPDIEGRYPYFNISSRLTRPKFDRISDLGETEKHRSTYDRHSGRDDPYSVEEG